MIKSQFKALRSVGLSGFLICAFLCLLVAAHAQSAAPTTPSRPEFEVASIKPNTGGNPNRTIRMLPEGRLNAENLPLRFLIRLAYDVKDYQISGGPSWINSDPYDVAAKAESSFTPEQMRPMLQTLLADRFKLTLHRETKEVPVYELTAAKGGLKLAASREGNCIALDPKSPPQPPRPGQKLPNYCGIIRMGRGLIDASGIPISRLLTSLSDILGRTVIDKTGFTGTFDVHMQFAPDEAIVDPVVGGQAGPAPAAGSAGPSIFTALQEQLGLRLESSKGPVEMLVIDHVERPSEN